MGLEKTYFQFCMSVRNFGFCSEYILLYKKQL